MIIYVYEMSGNYGFYTYSLNIVSYLSLKYPESTIIFHTARKNHNNIGCNVITLDNLDNISKKNLWYPFRIVHVIKTLVANHKKRILAIKKYKPDIVSIQQVVPIFDQFVFLSIRKKAKLFVTVHDVVPPQRSPLWSLKSLKKTYLNSDHLIVHTQANKKMAQDLFKIDTKISLIPHGIEISNKLIDKSVARNQLGISNKFTLLFFGVIRQSKGLDILLNSVVGLDIQLLIAGSPHESFKMYDDLIEKYNIRAIKYIRFISDDEIPLFFSAADYLCLPYVEFNSQSGVLMQAISYGLPVIASNLPTFCDFINENEIGIIFENRNVEDLSSKIKFLIANDKSRFTKGINDCRIKYSWPNIVDRYYQLFYESIKKD